MKLSFATKERNTEEKRKKSLHLENCIQKEWVHEKGKPTFAQGHLEIIVPDGKS